MNTAFILFPHHLFEDIEPLRKCDHVYLVEEWLFFRQYKFHKQKLLFHRASMKAYDDYLAGQSIPVTYIPTTEAISDIRQLIPWLKAKSIEQIHCYDPCDDWLEKRIKSSCSANSVAQVCLESPLFINSKKELEAYLQKKKKYFQTDFYIHQRKSRNILVDAASDPLHGKWSFDAANRLKYPKNTLPPVIDKRYRSSHLSEAAVYVEQHFSSNYGEIDPAHFHPVTHAEADKALSIFLKERFAAFGAYEDAIVRDQSYLNHSILSPMINTGLLLPGKVVMAAIDYAADNSIPYNSLEGFLRQVLGWREFIRMIYWKEGTRQRTTNYWQFTRKIPASFYSGDTGIEPIDATIKKLKKTAYNHHIERLMVLSNFMLLCEFDPNEVYRWFMEMYIDAYDWVMVPNVYGMGQFADGGIMCTKPYISGSNYIIKMSDYKKSASWTGIWDALFWRFLHRHRSFFLENPRLNMLIKTFDKWDANRKHTLLETAENFLISLDKQQH